MANKPTVLITGASSGLGFAFAKEYAKRNFNIVMVSNDPDRLTISSDEIMKITS